METVHTQPSSQKALAGAGVGGPLGMLALWGLQSAGVNMPVELYPAVGSLVSSLVAWLVRN